MSYKFEVTDEQLKEIEAIEKSIENMTINGLRVEEANVEKYIFTPTGIGVALEVIFSIKYRNSDKTSIIGIDVSDYDKW